MCNWSSWEKKLSVVHSVSCKLFKTKKELGMRQEIAKVGPGLPRFKACWGKVGDKSAIFSSEKSDCCMGKGG